VVTLNELLDYLRNKRVPVSCDVPAAQNGHVLVQCGTCLVMIPVDDPLTVTTANAIERRLEPCLGPHWMP
jgi:hypothetical protein